MMTQAVVDLIDARIHEAKAASGINVVVAWAVVATLGLLRADVVALAREAR